MNSGFLMSRPPALAERVALNQILEVDDPETFWGGESLTVFWDNDLVVGGLNGLIKEVFTEAETINYL